MIALKWRLLPLLVQLVSCSSGQDCFDNYLERHRTEDFNYRYSIEKTNASGEHVADTISLAKVGERIAWVNSDVISVKSSHWSYAAYRKQGISVSGLHQGRSSYFYAPQDFISVLEFAKDSAQSIECKSGVAPAETEVVIALRANALSMVEVRLQIGPNNSPKSMVVVYRDSSSSSEVTYTIAEQDPSSSVARPYITMLEEVNGALVAKDALSIYKSVAKPVPR